MAKHNLTIRIDDEEREWIEREAKAQYRTAANFILYVLKLYRAQNLEDTERRLTVSHPSPQEK